MRIQVWSSRNVLIRKGGHEPQTRLILLFKRIWGYRVRKIYIIAIPSDNLNYTKPSAKKKNYYKTATNVGWIIFMIC